jgi:ribonuclease HI
MNATVPRFFLYSECRTEADHGSWRFVLRHADGSQRLTAEHVEPSISGERLELLSVVRGLESLDEPSRVTLMTACTYVREGIRHGVAEWRVNGWRWERFGQMVPVKDLDLWQRVDRAMQFHQIDCRTYRFDPPHHKMKRVRSATPARRRSSRKGKRPGTTWFSIRRGLQYCLERVASLRLRRTAGTVR